MCGLAPSVFTSARTPFAPAVPCDAGGGAVGVVGTGLPVCGTGLPDRGTGRPVRGTGIAVVGGAGGAAGVAGGLIVRRGRAGSARHCCTGWRSRCRSRVHRRSGSTGRGCSRPTSSMVCSPWYSGTCAGVFVPGVLVPGAAAVAAALPYRAPVLCPRESLRPGLSFSDRHARQSRWVARRGRCCRRGCRRCRCRRLPGSLRERNAPHDERASQRDHAHRYVSFDPHLSSSCEA